jgi:hypothetical protein
MEKWKVLLVSIFIAFSSCVSDKKEGPIISDATLFGLTQSPTSFSYYKNNPDTLDSDPASPHFPYVRIRFNPRALSVMNASLSGLSGTSFPDESMIVKEVYDVKGGSLQTYAVMYKSKSAGNSGNGWVWNEMRADGSVIYSSARKGDQCVSCHQSGTSVDLVRTFGLH